MKDRQEKREPSVADKKAKRWTRKRVDIKQDKKSRWMEHLNKFFCHTVLALQMDLNALLNTRKSHLETSKKIINHDRIEKND
jgi:hypothetical protein